MTPEQWARVDRLFHDALERPEADGAAFLDEASAGDEGLRPLVTALLEADQCSDAALGRSSARWTRRPGPRLVAGRAHRARA